MINTTKKTKDQQKNSKKIKPENLTNPRKGSKRFSLIPEEIKQRKDLSVLAKYIYGDLIKFVGKNNYCFPKRATLAESCSISIKMLDKGIKELKDAGLIYVQQRGLKKSNVYYFIEQEWQKTTPVCLQPEKDANKQEANHPPPITKENSGVGVFPEMPVGGTPIVIDHCINTYCRKPEPRKAMQHDIAKKMIDTWVQIVEEGGKAIELGDKLIAYLKQALKDRFGGCLEKWKSYCERVASSKYLMGEKEIKGVWQKKWRASLEWCLRFSNIDKVLSGNLYGCGDRVKKPTVSDVKKVETEVKQQIAQSEESESIKQLRGNLIKRLGIFGYQWLAKECVFEETEDGGIDLKTPSKYFSMEIINNIRWSDKIAESARLVAKYVSINGSEITDWEEVRRKRNFLREQEHTEIEKTGARDAISSFFDLCKSQGILDAIKT